VVGPSQRKFADKGQRLDAKGERDVKAKLNRGVERERQTMALYLTRRTERGPRGPDGDLQNGTCSCQRSDSYS
jgi:hypothetical protein